MAAEMAKADTVRRMREVIVSAIATRSMPLSEAAAEARGLARGIQSRVSAAAIAEAVDDILRELGAYQAPATPQVLSNQPLQPATPEDLADALAYAMRFDERGKARRTGVEYAAHLAAAALVRHLELSGFVLMRRPPAHRHVAGEGPRRDP